MCPDTSFAGLVKRRRIALGMSQAALADLVGRSASAIRSWERGASTPTDDNIVTSVAAVLGIEEDLLRGAVGMPPGSGVGDLDEVGGEALEVFAQTDSEDGAAPETSVPSAPGSVEEASKADSGSLSPGDIEEAEGPPPDEAPGESSPEEPSQTPGPVVERDDEPASLSPGVETQSVIGEPLTDQRDPGPLPDAAEVSGPSERLAPVAAAVSTRTVPIPIGEPPVQPAARSYLDDPDQMMTYWIRAALTVAFAMFLLVVLFWALGKLGDSIGEVWDLVKAGS
jgi:transcriptional regulator with XRE-family HTH domain